MYFLPSHTASSLHLGQCCRDGPLSVQRRHTCSLAAGPQWRSTENTKQHTVAICWIAIKRCIIVASFRGCTCWGRLMLCLRTYQLLYSRSVLACPRTALCWLLCRSTLLAEMPKYVSQSSYVEQQYFNAWGLYKWLRFSCALCSPFLLFPRFLLSRLICSSYLRSKFCTISQL